jgi:hypothetical protein
MRFEDMNPLQQRLHNAAIVLDGDGDEHGYAGLLREAIDQIEAGKANTVGKAHFNGFAPENLPPILISCVAKLWPGSRGMFWEQCIDRLPGRIAALIEEIAPKKKTPAAQWREDGEADPHGDRYDCAREQLCMGTLSDDDLANAAFLNYDRRPSVQEIIEGKALSPIAYMTAVKDRIRWLSRQLEKAKAPAGNVELAGCFVYHSESGWQQVAEIFNGDPDTVPLFRIDAAGRPVAEVQEKMLKALKAVKERLDRNGMSGRQLPEYNLLADAIEAGEAK